MHTPAKQCQDHQTSHCFSFRRLRIALAPSCIGLIGLGSSSSMSQSADRQAHAPRTMDLPVAIRKLCSVTEGSVGLKMGLPGVDDNIRVRGRPVDLGLLCNHSTEGIFKLLTARALGSLIKSRQSLWTRHLLISTWPCRCRDSDGMFLSWEGERRTKDCVHWSVPK